MKLIRHLSLRLKNYSETKRNWRKRISLIDPRTSLFLRKDFNKRGWGSGAAGQEERAGPDAAGLK